jgi:mono/diheme cytochrome c family protein
MTVRSDRPDATGAVPARQLDEADIGAAIEYLMQRMNRRQTARTSA